MPSTALFLGAARWMIRLDDGAYMRRRTCGHYTWRRAPFAPASEAAELMPDGYSYIGARALRERRLACRSLLQKGLLFCRSRLYTGVPGERWPKPFISRRGCRNEGGRRSLWRRGHNDVFFGDVDFHIFHNLELLLRLIHALLLSSNLYHADNIEATPPHIRDMKRLTSLYHALKMSSSSLHLLRWRMRDDEILLRD